jgi:hypothetical protein
MKVETVISARSIWLLEMRHLNPRGRNLYRLIGPRLYALYGFKEPSDFDEVKGVQYIGGEFSPSGSNNDLTGITVTVFNDGIVAQTCTSTDDSDSFLSRTLEQLAKDNYIAYSPEMVKRKQYATEFIVRPEVPIAPIQQFNPLYRLLSEIIYPQQPSAQFEVSSLIFDTDPTLPKRQVPFTFQRRANTPFEETLYYSHGPFSSEQHMLVLNELEKGLTALAVNQPIFPL